MRHIFMHIRKKHLRHLSVLMSLVILFSVSLNVAYIPVVSAENTPETAVELKAPSALLMDSATGTILYEKNSNERRAMASVTKIMTMLLAMEAIDGGSMTYDEMITGSAHAKSMGGSTIFLEEGEQLSVRDILKEHRGLVEGGSKKNSADPFVIALAKDKRCKVVTEETRTRNFNSPKIPDVCDAYSIDCIDFVGFARESKLNF